MKNHESPIIARSGPTQVNLAGISAKQLGGEGAGVNMLVFLRTLNRYLSREIDSRSSPDAFFPTL